MRETGEDGERERAKKDKQNRGIAEGERESGRMPYLYRSFSAKEPYNSWLFCGK